MSDNNKETETITLSPQQQREIHAEVELLAEQFGVPAWAIYNSEALPNAKAEPGRALRVSMRREMTDSGGLKLTQTIETIPESEL